MNIVTLSSQNQITLPVGLGLIPRERFLVDKQGGKIVLEPINGSLVDELVGSLEEFIPKDKKNIPVETAIKMAKIAKSRQVIADK